MADTTATPATYNLFVNLLEGKTLNLKFTTPNITAASIKHRLYEITKIPLRHQRLLTGTRHLSDSDSDSVVFPDATVHLLLRLAGGKGGFGSLLRGAATKAGQKKTSNFDACRDMSGRRLRHVNAENKLQEWREMEEQRRMEKKGEEFLKGLAKKGKKGSGDAAAEKYVEKYREESARCVSEVVDSVKEAMRSGKKRKGKGVVVEEPKSKRVKIWVDRNDSDTEEDDSDNEDEKEKSTLLDDGNSSGSNKEAEGSLDSVTGVKQEGESSGRGSCESGSEEEKEMVVHTVQESIQTEKNGMVEPVVENDKIDASASIPCSASDTVLGVEAMQDEKMNCNGIEMQPQEISKSGDGQGVESTLIVSEVNGSSESSPVVQEETVANGNTAETEKPLNFDEFNSAAEMEVLGPERLKSELQAHGLKCGGTLRERAARLFMLKSTPIEKIPKKLLAKK